MNDKKTPIELATEFDKKQKEKETFFIKLFPK